MRIYIICKENSSFIRSVIFEPASDWRESFQTILANTCSRRKSRVSYIFTPLRNSYCTLYYIQYMSIYIRRKNRTPVYQDIV